MLKSVQSDSTAMHIRVWRIRYASSSLMGAISKAREFLFALWGNNPLQVHTGLCCHIKSI